MGSLLAWPLEQSPGGYKVCRPGCSQPGTHQIGEESRKHFLRVGMALRQGGGQGGGLGETWSALVGVRLGTEARLEGWKRNSGYTLA
jgi:hypothetical protein